MRRFLFVSVAVVGIASVLTVFTPANDKTTSELRESKDVPANGVACAKECANCALACDTCIAYCVKMLADGKKDHVKTLQACQDCSAICATSASIVARNGPFSMQICGACRDACKRCGDLCDQMKGDETMIKCAEECRKCEKACIEMLTQ
jgi:hypothetical protein